MRPRSTRPAVDDNQLATVRWRAAAIQQQCATLAHDVAALASEVTELIERPTSPPLSVSVDEDAHLLGLSRSTLSTLLGAGTIRSLKVGSRRLIPRQALDEFLQRDDTLGGWNQS